VVEVNKINVELLRKTIEWAESESVKAAAGERSEWNQGTWLRTNDCGTACCVAGKVAYDEGFRVLDDVLGVNTGKIIDADGVESDLSISEIAQDRLGLSHNAGAALFDGDNDIADLWHIANVITNGEIEIPVRYSSSPEMVLARAARS
jgi:hypothetical protein